MIWMSLLSWFATKGIGSITARIEKWEERKAQAQALGNAIEVKNIDAKIAALQIAADDRAKDGAWVRRYRAFIRSMIAIPVIILEWKVLVNDMAFQRCGGTGEIVCTPEPGTFVIMFVGAVLTWYLAFK